MYGYASKECAQPGMWPSSRKTRIRGLFRRSVLASISGVCSRKEEYYQNIIWYQLIDGTLNSKIWQLDITWFFWTNLLANVEAPVGIEPILISLPRVQQRDFDNACRSSCLCHSWKFQQLYEKILPRQNPSSTMDHRKASLPTASATHKSQT